MGLYPLSRHLKVGAVQIETADGEFVEVPKLPQTTVQDIDISSDAEWYVVRADETFESIAFDQYYDIGGANIWWVLAMLNPHIEYPLDLQAGDRIIIPPTQWVQSFLRSQDDWEVTWRNVAR